VVSRRPMIRRPSIVLLLLIVACSTRAPAPIIASVADTLAQQEVSDSSLSPATEASDTNLFDVGLSDYDTLFVTIADTGRDHAALQRSLVELYTSFGKVLDSTSCPYDPQLDSLRLPLDAYDELYAGQYLSRRIADSTISIEYVDAYTDSAAPRTMALVTGLWHSPERADQELRSLKPFHPMAFVIKAALYQGCIH
jgi:hypothetical protein